MYLHLFWNINKYNSPNKTKNTYLLLSTYVILSNFYNL